MPIKSIAIFFNAITNFKSDLRPLEQADTRNILFINSNILAQLTENQKEFFEKIHLVDPLTLDACLPLITQYLQEVKKENLRLITNDESCTPMVSKLIDHFDLPGYGYARISKFIDKLEMKAILDAQGIRTPRNHIFDRERYLRDPLDYIQDIEKDFKYPFVIKPVSLYGAADFQKIFERIEFIDHAEQAASSQFIFEIEEFIPGTLFHYDAIVRDSQIIFHSICEYMWPIALFQKGYPTGSIWLPHKDPRWKKLSDFHQQVITALQAPDGATHCELFLTPEGEVVFLEIAARPSGALVVPTIEKITGVNIEIAHFNLRLGRPVSITQHPATVFSLFCYIPKKNGKIIRLKLPALKSETTVEWHVKPGDETKPLAVTEDDIMLKPSNIAGIIVLNNADFASLYEDFITLKTAEFIETEAV